MALGILMLAATGLLWVVIGAVVGGAERNGLSAGAVQAAAAVLMLAVSLAVLLFLPGREVPAATRIWVMLSLAGSGFFNYFVLSLMGKAMRNGPNGVIWAAVQSALVFPFLVGVAVFGTPLTPLRAAGLTAIIASLAAFGLARDIGKHTAGTGPWKLATLGSFLLAGVNQNLSSLPSYFPDAAAVGSVWRTFSAQLGTLTAFLLFGLRPALAQGRLPLRSPRLWRYACTLICVSLVSAYCLLYNGLDRVARSGAGAVGYPVLVGSCIVGFSLYSAIALKEKFRPLQLAGLLLGVAGIVSITL